MQMQLKARCFQTLQIIYHLIQGAEPLGQQGFCNVRVSRRA